MYIIFIEVFITIDRDIRLTTITTSEFSFFFLMYIYLNWCRVVNSTTLKVVKMIIAILIYLIVPLLQEIIQWQEQMKYILVYSIVYRREIDRSQIDRYAQHTVQYCYVICHVFLYTV